jgi:hypothetical protein
MTQEPTDGQPAASPNLLDVLVRIATAAERLADALERLLRAAEAADGWVSVRPDVEAAAAGGQTR